MRGRCQALLALAGLPLLLGVGAANVPALKAPDAKAAARTAPVCPPGSPECTPDCFYGNAPADASCCEGACCNEVLKVAPPKSDASKAKTQRACPFCPPCPFCP